MGLKTLVCITFVLCNTVLSSAQPTAVGDPRIILKSDSIAFQNPLWSPDGKKIALTTPGYQGIWTIDSTGGELQQITTKQAGYGFSWSSDSNSLLSRVSKTATRRKLQAIAIFDINSREEKQLSDFRSEMNSMPRWAQFDEKVVLISDDQIETFETGKVVPDHLKIMPTAPFYVLQVNKIMKASLPEESLEALSPYVDEAYLNLQVSPDGLKLAFEIYGGDLYVMNVDGSELHDLGRANRPAWSPDSQYLFANVIEDDGTNYTKADIYLFSTDGKLRRNLTSDTDLLALNPNCSPDGTKILFDEPTTGAIYELSLSNADN